MSRPCLRCSQRAQCHAALHEATVPTLLHKSKLLANSLGRSQTQCQGRDGIYIQQIGA